MAGIPRAERRRRTRLPLALVFLSLLGSVLVPYLLQQRSEELRLEIAETVEPARRMEAQVEEALAEEVSLSRGYALTGDTSYLKRARAAALARDSALRQLQAKAPLMGPAVAAEIAALGREIDEWRAAADSLSRVATGTADFVAHIPEQQRRHDEAIQLSGRIQADLARIAGDHREQIRRYQAIDVICSVVLVALALAAVLAVAALTRRQERLADQAAARADQEASLRALARTLSGALSVKELVDHVAAEAVRSTRAFGAYVERAEDREIEVVAGAGRGVPPMGTRAPYPGSLTDEIIDAGEVRALAEVAQIGESMAPYLHRSCEQCTGLVVPLSHEGAVLGALILLRSPEQGGFSDEEAAHARTLGDLLSVAFRRAVVMEDEQRARAQAEAAVRTRDEVLSVVSHDLRNPLHTIGMSSAFLLDVLPGGERGMERKQLEIIKRAVDGMDRMIKDLLDITRIESGRMRVECDTVPVPALMDEVVAMMTPLAEGGGLRLECRIGSDVPLLYADRDRLVQVFSNLIGNAIKFTPPGGVVSIAADGADGGVSFAVSDTGAGMPAEHLPRLFDRFWQARRTDRRGLGLGLPIVKGIVDAHGGRLRVESTPGVGSTFEFTIPNPV
jgi:signal transduction histidine kinase/CHASE3 domain sensor protein